MSRSRAAATDERHGAARHRCARTHLAAQRGRLVVNEGSFRDGLVHWSNGRRSWLARDGPGIMLGDVDSGRHFMFRRS
jgi:hypothetical protein